jgi:hypothetical protein
MCRDPQPAASTYMHELSVTVGVLSSGELPKLEGGAVGYMQHPGGMTGKSDLGHG